MGDNIEKSVAEVAGAGNVNPTESTPQIQFGSGLLAMTLPIGNVQAVNLQDANLSTGNLQAAVVGTSEVHQTIHPAALQTIVPTVHMPSVVNAGLMPDKFDGTGFKTWQQKMFFFLTTLKLEKYLTEDKPVLSPHNTDAYLLASVEA